MVVENERADCLFKAFQLSRNQDRKSNQLLQYEF